MSSTKSPPLESPIYDPSTRSESSPNEQLSESFSSITSASSPLTSENTSNSSYTSATEEQNKYLDYDDYFAAKKSLGKLCKTMVESSCRHARNEQKLNQNLDKLDKSLDANISVVKDFVIDFDLKTAAKVEEMIERIDSKMTMLEDITSFSAALDSLEEWLNLIGDQNQRDLDTMGRAKHNLAKQKVLQKEVEKFYDQSIKSRAIFDALELDDPRMLRKAFAATNNKPINRVYGIKENKHFIPGFMADIEDLETSISGMKEFFFATHLMPQNYFDKIDTLLEEIKEKTAANLHPISAATSMESLYTDASEAVASDYHNYAPSDNENGAIGIEVSRSSTNRSNSETSLASNFSSESTQVSSFDGYDTVGTTQTSSKEYDTVESTQASDASVSSVADFLKIEYESDKTQNSDTNVSTAISPRSSSLKTAMSLHDVISSSDSMGSSSTIAI
uniref:Uncharacterized protein n=1 Tax=Panagrolaimus davidi TaxID=227884 RepID=A0A914PKX6_9BILA